MTEIEELREQGTKLRERVAVLEARSVTWHPMPAPLPGLPWSQPFTPIYPITCGGSAQ